MYHNEVVLDFIIGEIIPLTLRVVKNNKPESGLIDMTVRVVDQVDGVEVLASSPVPETAEPGVYTFQWGSAPQEERELLALFEFGPRTSAEFFRIRRTGLDQPAQIIDVEVFEGPIVSVQVIEDEIVNVEVRDSEVVDILVVEEQIVNVEIVEEIVEVLVICA